MLELKRLTSVDALNRLQEKARPLLDLRNYNRAPNQEKYQILICGGTGCTSSGSSPSSGRTPFSPHSR